MTLRPSIDENNRSKAPLPFLYQTFPMSPQIPDHEASNPQMRGSEDYLHDCAPEGRLATAGGAQRKTELLPSHHAQEGLWTA